MDFLTFLGEGWYKEGFAMLAQRRNPVSELSCWKWNGLGLAEVLPCVEKSLSSK